MYGINYDGYFLYGAKVKDYGDNKPYFNFYFIDRESFYKSLKGKRSKYNYFVFNSVEDAKQFMKEYNQQYPKEEWKHLPDREWKVEFIPDFCFPSCDMDCFACNKKNKYTCQHLKNPYQNICGFNMAEFEENFNLDKTRLDAPCESCLAAGCPYNQIRR